MPFVYLAPVHLSFCVQCTQSKFSSCVISFVNTVPFAPANHLSRLLFCLTIAKVELRLYFLLINVLTQTCNLRYHCLLARVAIPSFLLPFLLRIGDAGNVEDSFSPGLIQSFDWTGD